jgi:LmbE family N-acetylglucosaminyl deacetylase
MAVHAHPDDEATGTGGILALYAAQGIRTVLVTCTDGGCGDGPNGVKPGQPGHDPAAVVAQRRIELDASCAILNVAHLETLGYADSGMMGWDQNNAPGAFWNTPVDEAAARLVEMMELYRPDVVVTYDAYGFYGHPDHIQAHRITMAAVEASGIPAKVYWTTIPHSTMEEFEVTMREFGETWDDASGDGASGNGASGNEATRDGDTLPEGPAIGVPDDLVTTSVDTAAFAQQKFDALAAHGSQTENIFFLRLGLERFAKLMGQEAFLRVRDSTGADLPESDLFAGLRN